MTELAAYFEGLPNGIVEHWSKPGPGMQHIFTDGAHFRHRHSRLEYSAWAAVSASSGQVICGAPLHGVCQSIGRAAFLGPGNTRTYGMTLVLSWMQRRLNNLHFTGFLATWTRTGASHRLRTGSGSGMALLTVLQAI